MGVEDGGIGWRMEEGGLYGTRSSILDTLSSILCLVATSLRRVLDILSVSKFRISKAG